MVTNNYSEPCYENESYSSQEMLNEFLATIQHGMQHNTFKEEEIYFKIEGKATLLICPNITQSDDDFMSVDLEELNKFAYSPHKGQFAYDFITIR